MSREEMLTTSTIRLAAVPIYVAISAAGLLGAGIASADPVPANECGAHTDALDCIRDTSPPNPAEQTFLSTVGPHFPNVSNADMLQYARGVCVMLRGGSVTWYVVKDLGEHLGTTKQAAGQVMDGAMQADCPNLKVGPDGVAR